MLIFTAKYLLDKVATEVTNLNGFPVMSLDEFVKQGTTVVAADNNDEEDESLDNSKKPDKKEPTKKEKEEEFGLGSKNRPIEDKEMQEYLGRVKNKEKSKQDQYQMPYIHSSNVKIVNDNGKEYDLDNLRAQIMKRPTSLLRQNEKMKHSDGTSVQYYNVGLPALKGLAVNEKTGKFVVVDTCPGSGACKTFCYAMKGSYVMFKHTSMAQTQVLNFLLNHPDKFRARLKAEIGLAISDMDEDTTIVIRWHDAGDFFSPQYMSLAFDIARAFPDTEFYAYTKLGDVAKANKPKNFLISFSEGASPSEAKKVDLTKIKHSVVIPKADFWDLIITKGTHPVKGKNGQVQFKDAAAWDKFKNRLVEKYKIPKDTILIYDEYMKMKQDDELGDTPNYWNVVVPPGGGDNSSNDNLVHGSYLMWH